MFGGTSNWRDPVWSLINMLIVNALGRYHLAVGDGYKVECPTNSGQMLTLGEAADELRRRLIRPFTPDANGERPCHGDDIRYAKDPSGGFRPLLGVLQRGGPSRRWS